MHLCFNAELCPQRFNPRLAEGWCQGFSVSGAQWAGRPAAHGAMGKDQGSGVRKRMHRGYCHFKACSAQLESLLM